MFGNKIKVLRPIQQRCFNPLDTVDILSPSEPDQTQRFLRSHAGDIIVSRPHDPADTQRRLLVLQYPRNYDHRSGLAEVNALRSKTHSRAVDKALAPEIPVFDAPDWGPADPTTLPFTRVRPEVFPVTG